MANKQIQSITVIGAGQMGHQIAMLAALGGYETILQDVHENALNAAKEKLDVILTKWVQKGKLSEDRKLAAFSRLQYTTDLEKAASGADLIIEAVVEKLDVKQEVFAKLEELAPAETIFATNSSTIVNSLIASVTNRPDKFINMHFFFPPLVMDCVEVVMSDQTSEETAKLAMEVTENMNRTGVLLRKEISGFVANRILGALQREALYLYEKGIVDYKDIDLICRKALGHPIGPFELMDLSGIDVGYFVMQQRFNETGNQEDKPNACIEEKVNKGHLGRKTGKGWYDYPNQGVKN
ncbi:3-hydroxyacyl-CoA dehydrogenase family protein [Peribacillus frigoritolerans]|uniref:3-hydroxyacyl-CoA dehydrogenase family protein n=1 Tax=Peribacillus TaxID=2675229 RepID=UPI0007BF1C5A|nr:3-hydroxyacyl-CoA dehydrogenase family protein [Peribacillus frigoritolerans]PRS32803.1 3-hydroxyacyl-CoA dehydrogenase family protein [Bacillus sp. RJGP41]QNK50879.1 3-hydroxyacyl-CoA dehydrogenase family protein [Brevibacterium sp. PAMC23299]MCY8938106.1 3-hydroxyacyl-CoA dehydrogenase family protein [Peribacillus frigoritolerans]MDG4847320.1 3-hydroxyacyl-CoA dehydrogenase family protein [Peribacillus frigoritolerans]WHX68357.1 3-hydroxyacyl-CoA dehydrogenase family protein [Peribacillus